MLDKLKRELRVNPKNKHFPTGIKGTPTTRSLTKCIEIYELIREYSELENDYDKSNYAVVKNVLSKRMSEIVDELFKYWIIDDTDMETN